MKSHTGYENTDVDVSRPTKADGASDLGTKSTGAGLGSLTQAVAQPVDSADLGAVLDVPGPSIGVSSPLDEPVPSSHALVPVPRTDEPKQSKRRSLWKRLALRGSARRQSEKGLDGDAGESPIGDRLETIEGQLAALEDSISVHFDQLEHRFTQLWEIEDALNQVVKLPEQLTELGDRQKEMARSVRSLEGRVRALAVLCLVLSGAIAVLLATSL